jgi:hypothetical protein
MWRFMGEILLLLTGHFEFRTSNTRVDEARLCADTEPKNASKRRTDEF